MSNETTTKKSTHIVEMACLDTDSHALLRNGAIIMCDLTAEQAVNKFLKTERHIAHYELATTYTVGHEGQEEHIWDFSHYEVYEPVDTKLPSVVILRYRRRHFKKMPEQDIEHSLTA